MADLKYTTYRAALGTASKMLPKRVLDQRYVQVPAAALDMCKNQLVGVGAATASKTWDGKVPFSTVYKWKSPYAINLYSLESLYVMCLCEAVNEAPVGSTQKMFKTLVQSVPPVTVKIPVGQVATSTNTSASWLLAMGGALAIGAGAWWLQSRRKRR